MAAPKSFLAAQVNGLVAFDAAEVLSEVGGDEVTSATLILDLVEATSRPVYPEAVEHLTAHRVIQPWTEMGAVWVCADDQDPSFGGLSCDVEDEWDSGLGGNNPWSSTAGHPAVLVEENGEKRVEFDVTEDVQALVSGDPTPPSWTLILGPFGYYDFFVFETIESGVPPRLAITHTPPPPPPQLPPEPSTVAPPLETTEITTPYDGYSFLFEGADPIQTGVTPGAIEPGRIGVVRGAVKLRSGQPATGVTVTVKDHPELGSTLTRADGMFDLAVNGGGPLVLELSRDDLLDVERTVKLAWQKVVTIDDLVMVIRDPAVTEIDFSDPMSVAEGTPVIDEDGYRRQVLMFRENTVATMHLPDESTQPLPVIHVRSTEFTVGETGLEAMPAMLPPNTAYTYAAEFGIDEAEAADATRVTFDPPAISYTLDFIEDELGAQAFRPGEPVPAGVYDAATGSWNAENNGIVLRVVDVGGQVGLDVTYDEVENVTSQQELDALGIDAVEVAEVLARFPVGTQLWRAETTHFSAWDLNWGMAPPLDADEPPGDGPEPPPLEDPCEVSGSVIECENQVLGESVPLSGTPFSLTYRSSRARGGPAYRTTLPITGPTVNSGVKRVVVEADVAGRHFEEELAPVADAEYTLEWDGLDVYGRLVQGPQAASICVGHVYEAEYYGMGPCWDPAICPDSQPYDATFGYAGNGRIITGERGHNELTLWKCFGKAVTSGAIDHRQLSEAGGLMLGTVDAEQASDGLGGWTVDIHHTFVPWSGELYLGNGKVRRGVGAVVDRFAGNGTPSGPAAGDHRLNVAIDDPLSLAVGADGSLYVGNAGRIVRVKPDEQVEPVAGTGTVGYSGDGGLASSAQVGYVNGLASAPDGSLYLADGGNHRIRRILPDGTITTVAGSASSTTSVQDVDAAVGSPATSAALGTVEEVAVRDDGVVFFSHEAGNAWTRINYVDQDGILRHFGGSSVFQDPPPPPPFDPERPPVDQTWVAEADRMVFGPQGELYAGGTGYSGADVVRLAETGSELMDSTWVLGMGFAGDTFVAVQQNAGYLYRLFYRDANGDFPLLAGGGEIDVAASTPALSYHFDYVSDLAVGPDGGIYAAEQGADQIVRISTPMPGGSQTGTTSVASRDGTEVYVFSARGRHLETRSAITDAVLWQFGYDANGLLTSITDRDGGVTTIDRGATITITSPDGVATTLALDGNGYLDTVTNAETETYDVQHDPDGLLTSYQTPSGATWTFAYDANGRLAYDTDAEMGEKELSRTNGIDAWDVDLSFGGVGDTHDTTYSVATGPDGETVRTVTLPDSTTNSLVAAADDGARTVTMADGSVHTYLMGPDPRFGMQAPVVEQYTHTPPDMQPAKTVYTRRTVDPGDILVKEVALNDDTFTNAFETRYDPATATLTWTTPEGRTGSTVYDAAGRVVQINRGGLASVDILRYPDGKLQEISSGSGLDQRRTTYSYGTHGFLDVLTGYLDAVGLPVDFDPDLVGRPTTITLADGSQIGMGYDLDGRANTVVPPGKPAHLLDYNGLGQLETYTPPITGATDYGYDKFHQLDDIERGANIVVDFTYDGSSGQLQSITMPQSPGSGSITAGYDPSSGKLTSLSGPDGIDVSYTYDGELVTSTAWTAVGGISGSVEQTYDAEHRVQEQRVNGSHPATFSYDLDGLLEGAGAETLVPDATTGLLRDTTLGNVTSHFDYNQFGELTFVQYLYNGTTVLYEATLTRDDFGRIDSKEEIVEDATPVLYEYDYDDQGRLGMVWEDGLLVADYDYDANGNTTSEAVSGTVGVADDQDRLTAWGANTYTYTAAGALETKTGAAVTTYEYDELGNLRSVDLGGGNSIDYAVDALGRRMLRDDGTTERRYLYQDRLDPVAELDAANNVVSRFVYGSRTNVPDYMVSGGATYRLVTDHLGSVRLVVDTATGTVVQRLDYDPRGRVLAETGTPAFQPFGFAGGIYDNATGLVGFGARDYDPQSGRWTAPDPLLFDAGDPNLYAYCYNDPLNLVDRDGRSPAPAPAPGPEPGAANGGGYPANGGNYPRRGARPGSGGLLQACMAHPILCGAGIGYCLGCPHCCGFGPEPAPDPDSGKFCPGPDPYRTPAPPPKYRCVPLRKNAGQIGRCFWNCTARDGSGGYSRWETRPQYSECEEYETD